MIKKAVIHVLQRKFLYRRMKIIILSYREHIAVSSSTHEYRKLLQSLIRFNQAHAGM